MIWKPNVTVAAIVENNGRFLLVEEEAEGALVLNQPAGHLDPGETLLEAVVRETLEESAWHVEPDALIGVYRWPHPTKDITYLRFAFSARTLRHDASRPLDKEIRRVLWLTPDEAAAEASRHRSPQVQRCINDYRNGPRYPLALLKELEI